MVGQSQTLNNIRGQALFVVLALIVIIILKNALILFCFVYVKGFSVSTNYGLFLRQLYFYAKHVVFLCLLMRLNSELYFIYCMVIFCFVWFLIYYDYISSNLRNKEWESKFFTLKCWSRRSVNSMSYTLHHLEHGCRFISALLNTHFTHRYLVCGVCLSLLLQKKKTIWHRELQFQLLLQFADCVVQ